jgi:hypothetical protein
MDHTLFDGRFMFVIILQGKSYSKKKLQSNQCVKYYRQLNSNFHMPYNQGAEDHPLHGNFIQSFFSLKLKFDF